MKNLFNLLRPTLQIAVWIMLCALMFTACSTKDEAGDTDAPLDSAPSGHIRSSTTHSSTSLSTGKAAVSTTEKRVIASPPPARTMSIDGAVHAAGSSATPLSATSSVSSGGFGIRGGRASETSVRRDGIAITDPGTSGKVSTISRADIADGAVPASSIEYSVDDFVAMDEPARVMPTERDAIKYKKSETKPAPGEMEVLERDEVSEDVLIKKLSEREVEKEIEPEPAPEPVQRAGQLTAGEWSDLTEWNFWNSVIAAKDWSHMKEHWGFGKGERISVRVDNGSQPIPDAVAKLYDKSGNLLWTARTDNYGRVELFTGLDAKNENGPYEVVVTSGKQETKLGGVDPSREQSPSESPLFARLRKTPEALNTVDVMFVVDATGSMGDELNYIKAELESVIDRVHAEMERDFTIRLSTNVYRDRGDEYVVRSHPFSENVNEVAGFLRAQSAGGGGDAPEAVEEALEDAIDKHEWSASAQSRFLFLVLDAPPHHTPERLAKLRELTKKAAEKGIRIIPVSGSGVDKETEFLMRFFAVHTGGTYVFLTDHSGIGESHIEPTIGHYAVEYLDDLIVRLIVQYTQQPESIDAITARKPELH